MKKFMIAFCAMMLALTTFASAQDKVFYPAKKFGNMKVVGLTLNDIHKRQRDYCMIVVHVPNLITEISVVVSDVKNDNIPATYIILSSPMFGKLPRMEIPAVLNLVKSDDSKSRIPGFKVKDINKLSRVFDIDMNVLGSIGFSRYFSVELPMVGMGFPIKEHKAAFDELYKCVKQYKEDAGK